MTTAEVSQSTGATLRQLQWWDEQNVIRPTLIPDTRFPERGVRDYGVHDLLQVKLAVGLKQRGISFQQIRQILANPAIDSIRNGIVVVVGSTSLVVQLVPYPITWEMQMQVLLLGYDEAIVLVAL